MESSNTSKKNLISNLDSGFDLKRAVGLILGNLPFFIFSLLICYLFAFLYLRYTKPVYIAESRMYIKDSKDNAGSAEDVLKQLGYTSGGSSMNNELIFMSNTKIVGQVVKDLQLYVQYFAPGRISMSEMYSSTPFRVNIANADLDSINKNYAYSLKSKGMDSFVITYNKNTYVGRWGDSVKLDFGNVVLQKTGKQNLQNGTLYKFNIENPEGIAKRSLRSLIVLNKDKASTIVNLSYKDFLRDRAEAFLNKLMEEYQNDNISYKNEIANSTMNFIDDRLSIVNHELAGVEKEMEDYKGQNNIVDLNKQMAMLEDRTNQYNNQIIPLSPIKPNRIN